MTAKEFLNKHGKALGTAVVGGIVAPTAIHLGLDTRVFDGKSIYDMTEGAARFLPYLVSGYQMGKAFIMEYEGNTGRKLNNLEKTAIYVLGGAAAAGLWEGWKNLGVYWDSLHNTLENGLGDNYIKKVFPGQGWESINDAAKTIVETTAFGAAKEYVSKKLQDRKEKKIQALKD